ncbi:putative galacturonosyltransferase 9 [Morus notabilis]|uniref:Hexosyltransferase n=1 Tax=Morus notabilis TaxID=981085 RepID=W9RPG5_9ROSA|nr:putative galacturonosyltransferase 9 [Morus notabilis]
MAVAVRGSRGGGGGFGLVSSSLRSFFSYRIFVSAMFSLLFIATLSVLLSTNPYTPHHDSALPTTGNAYVHRTFLALKSDPLKTRLDLIYKQANDHMTLVNSYAAYARKLKLEISKQLRMFNDLASEISDLQMKPGYRTSLFESDGPVDEDVLRQFEKEVKDKVKTARAMVAESKENYDNQLKIQKLKDTIFAVNELLTKAKKNGAFASLIAAKSAPKSLHCLAMRLVGEMISNPEKYRDEGPKPEFEDPSLYHYAIFSDNVIAVSVVVRSVVKNANEPWKHVFHVVTDRMNLAAMKVWFKMRPADGGAHVEVKAVEDFSFLNSSYVPVLRQLESANLQKFYFESREENATKDASNMKFRNPKYLSMLNHLRFYLPEIYPKLHKILFLDDDVVVQKDLTGLWKIDLDGKVNGAVETCFGSFHRYAQYLNFSHPLIKEKFNPKACAWAYGMNIFDLDAWRREKSTEQYHYWQNLNEDRTLWKLGTLPPGLITFYSTTKSLDKSWHVLGLGYNPSISMDAINRASVIHYNGNMKPWLDIAMNQYKNLWTKYVDNDMEFVQIAKLGDSLFLVENGGLMILSFNVLSAVEMTCGSRAAACKFRPGLHNDSGWAGPRI